MAKYLFILLIGAAVLLPTDAFAFARCKGVQGKKLLTLPKTEDYPIYRFRDNFCVSLKPLENGTARICWDDSCSIVAYDREIGLTRRRGSDGSVILMKIVDGMVEYTNKTKNYVIFGKRIR